MNKLKHFFVYVLCDPTKYGDHYNDLFFKYQPFYVGKSHGHYRFYEHLWEAENFKERNHHKANKIRKIKRITGELPIVLVYKNKLSEKEAHKTEMFLIEKIGRADLGLGPLTNLTNGGEGTSGIVVPASKKIKHSKLMAGINNPMYGKRGKKNPNYGRKHTPEAKEKIRRALTGSIRGPTPEKIKRKISRSLMGRKNKKGKNSPLFGIKRSKGSIIKMIENHVGFIGKKHSKKSKKLISKASKEMWKNNRNNLMRVRPRGKTHPLYGEHWSKEIKLKISRSLSGRKQSKRTILKRIRTIRKRKMAHENHY